MFNRIYAFIMFRFIYLLSITKIKTKEKVIYLTFDDGPEPMITESVISILDNYNAKATFFCTGENFEKHPDLIKLIRASGHVLGNHSYSHVNGLKEKFSTYIDDVVRSKELIQTNLFRPPWGALTLRKFVTIRSDNKIIMWSISSDDMISDTNWETYSKKMIKKTKPGSIILFHFSKNHSKNTLQILPIYLEKLRELKFNFGIIE